MNEILRDGDLVGHADLGGFSAHELAARFGTPLYVYDLDVVSGQVDALRAALPPVVELAYAVKANPSLGVVAHLAELGLGADVASAGELVTAIRAGVAPGTIVVTGPGKTEAELQLAVASGVRAVTVESPGELGRLEVIAANAGRRVPILLRSALAAAGHAERVRLIGDEGAGKFGMDGTDLIESASVAVRSPHFELLGLHAFGASNVLDADALADHVAATMAAARALSLDVGFDLRLVDAGGGLGIPYGEREAPLDLRILGRRLDDLARQWSSDPSTRDTRLLLEPGRFLVGPAGAYVARVVDRKRVNGSEVAILDGGIHHLLRPALVGQDHRLRRLSGALGASAEDAISGVMAATVGGATGGAAGDRGRLVPVTIAGPLCSGLDILATEILMAPPEPGDLIGVLDVGAYGFTESMPFFLSHPVPAEIALRDGQVRLLRPRLEPETWLSWQSRPTWDADLRDARPRALPGP